MMLRILLHEVGLIMKGYIFNMQKFSVHDGPGIRTTVFLKGCPLNCWWCHNPESQETLPEVMCFSGRCLNCGECVKECLEGALAFESGELKFIREKCRACGRCAGICPSKAREVAGREVSVDYVVSQVMKDRIFYDESGGGVTFSGGEPLMQIEFLYELLNACKDEGLNTAVDTSGFAPWQVMERVASKTDLFLYDIKLMDNEKHMKYTGVPNDVILENLKRLSGMGKSIWARIPVVPAINDDNENIMLTGEFLSKLGIQKVNILPYHGIAGDKYSRMSKDYKLKDLKEPSNMLMSEISECLKGFGLNVKIGG